MKEATSRLFGIIAVTTLAFGIAGCNGGPPEADDASPATQAATQPAAEEGEEHDGREGAERGEEHGGREGGDEAEGEHGEEGGHDEGGEGEESGVYIDKDETWDVVRRGARLVLAYNAASGAFVGTVENTTEGTLCAVRVEVHLGEGPELGPTERTDVRSGATTNIELSADGEDFEQWTAHPEMSACSGE